VLDTVLRSRCSHRLAEADHRSVLLLFNALSFGTPIGVLDPAMRPQIEALRVLIAAIDERLTRIAGTYADAPHELSNVLAETRRRFDG
jgi:hypothetical protein